MSVELQNVRATFLGTGVSSLYTPGIFAETGDQIFVYVNGVQTSGYILSGLGETSGINIDGNFANGATVFIERRTPITQDVDIRNNETLLEEVLETALDRRTMVEQEIADTASRAVLYPKGELGPTLGSPASRALTIMGFNALGAYVGRTASELAALIVAPIVTLLGAVAKGDPGANTMAIGIFAAAPNLNIPLGTDVVRTSGYAANGIGAADYVSDVAVNAAYVVANPLTSFISFNGRGFRLSLDQAVNATMFGALGNGVANDTTAAVSMFLFAATNGLQSVVFRRGDTYLIDTNALVAAADDLIIDAWGATIKTASVALQPMLNITGHRVRVRGGEWQTTSGSDQPWFFNVTGTHADIMIERAVKTPDAGGYHCYFRFSADGLKLRFSTFEGSNGFYIETSNFDISHNTVIGRAVGGDDCFAIKSITDSVRHGRIAFNHIENLASGLSIGSEIGILGVNDPGYTRTVGQIQFIGNTLKDCSHIVFIKPGAIDAGPSYDYRDGTVEDITVSFNELTDLLGLRFVRGIAISPARGARVRGVRGRGNVVRARSAGGVGRLVGGRDLYIPSGGGYTLGTAPASISDVTVEIDYNDPYEGQSNGAGRPGYPVASIESITRAGAVGEFYDIVVNTRGNGSAEQGLVVGFNILALGELRIERLELVNVNRGGVGGGGAQPMSPTIVQGQWSVASFAGPEIVPGYEANLLSMQGRGGFDTPGVYRVGGAIVLQAPGAAIADAVNAAAAPTQAEFNALVATVNSILARMRAATPTIVP